MFSVHLFFSPLIAWFFWNTADVNPKCEVSVEFIRLMNASKLEEARTLTAKGFEFISVSGKPKNAETYFSEFKKKQIFSPQMKVFQNELRGGHCEVSVLNSTKYNDYLNYPAFSLKYVFSFKDKLISRIQIDTLEGHSKNQLLIDAKFKAFEAWIQDVYPSRLEAYKMDRYSAQAIVLVKEYAEKKVNR